MKSKLIHDGAEKTYALVFAVDDEPGSLLLEFAEKNKLAATRICGIGGFREVKLGYYDIESKDYVPVWIREQVEVVSFVGNLCLYEGKPKFHIHVAVGKRDGTTRGGHFLEGRVRPTMELMLVESPTPLSRTVSASTGLPLWNL